MNDTTLTSISREDADKINEIFAYLDDDKDGYITYENVFNLLNRKEYKTDETQFADMLYNADNMTLSTESWYYMSDVLYPLQSHLDDNQDEIEKEKDYNSKSLKLSHLNPLYRTKGWSLSQLTDAYIKYGFFDLNYHYSLIKGAEAEAKSKSDRIYNLLTDLPMNVPSISLIIRHALATGQFLYVHILEAEKDPDKMTWEKLEELHERMGTIDIINKAKESEEILPQDVLFYDPDKCTGEIPNSIPDYSVFWHSVFENQMQDLPDYVIQDYFDTIVKPDIEANNDGVFIEPKNNIERDRMIEEHVYNEMEKYMQPWLWKRYAQLLTKPPFSISTWDDHNLKMNLKTY